jgi:hypothetical protein
MRQNFVLKLDVSDNEARVAFQQPVTIPANSELVVYWAAIYYEPAADYVAEGFDIQCDLPIKQFTNYITSTPSNAPAVELPIILSVPPSEQADQNADDPGALPTVGLRLREPFEPVKHELLNQEQQINSITFKMRDFLNDRQPNYTVNNLSISFCIKPKGEYKM